ncbi:dihydroxyacetone kinase subunit DhaL [Pasteurella atlantica]|uniref:Dihydroxyacetone kinase subunit DhaL n=2 Tax=Pasteurellaceae TaxID=712 RepID=A0ACC6HJQ6_9PAST|nr:dihydroxyacetone kinase subunit DhaL [Pasteurella atlantica]MDP8033909.1 dihydroxyacetone kinase subunit DhaL [Pasteurella atlantica]MDP8035912.1 dihydroxyacetone kinase subunit DhaL [Pasteurella atlantica]MDP8037749.1 dihydroxyacetone kinase subunit DhaL [Pasteurella atlantica]MDP8048145.1 dihydroxyacetone kinase subunit DhaL [Pasteurella atlantica]MDP8050235.1 dihydroxyacetone kinase subunit DhaL [Pasteurella atlantica]
MEITKQQIIQWIKNSQQLFEQHQDYLTQLDREIGDADHGLNMQRGFTKVLEKLPTVEDKDIGTILKTTGMTLLSQVGGASGPLFGSFYIKASLVANGKETLSLSEFHQLLKSGVEGIVSRGRAVRDDKTMCDVWLPILDDFEAMIEENSNPTTIFATLSEKAQKYAEATIPLKAKKGRASYLNERSIGHQDPGATSVSYLFLALSQVMEE